MYKIGTFFIAYYKKPFTRKYLLLQFSGNFRDHNDQFRTSKTVLK